MSITYILAFILARKNVVWLHVHRDYAYVSGPRSSILKLRKLNRAHVVLHGGLTETCVDSGGHPLKVPFEPPVSEYHL